MEEAKQTVISLVRVLQFVDGLFQIRSTEKEKNSLHAQKQGQLRRIRDAAQGWWEWQHVVNLAPNTFPPSGGYPLPAETLKAIMDGRYSWPEAGDSLHR